MPSQLKPGFPTDRAGKWNFTPQADCASETEPEQTLRLLDQANRSTMISNSVDARVPTFGLTLARPKRAWRSYTSSMVIHSCAAVLLFAISFNSAAIQRVVRNVVLIAPELKPYQPPEPHVTPVVHLRPYIPPPVPAALPPPPVKVAISAPPAIIQQRQPHPVPIPQPKIEAVQPPAPKIVEGVFARAEVARAPEPAKQIVPAGFGDPEGVSARSQKAGALTAAKLGGFDVPADAPANGTPKGVVGATSFGSMDGAKSGSRHSGVVRAGAFGDTTAAGAAGSRSGQLHAGGFADASAQPQRTPERAAAAPPASTAPEILFKPKPEYTAEARNLKIEGQVLLEVTLRADGTIQILRVIRGLGHGLDEAAADAARQVRFRPATRGGTPVDVNATLTITFALT